MLALGLVALFLSRAHLSRHRPRHRPGFPGVGPGQHRRLRSRSSWPARCAGRGSSARSAASPSSPFRATSIGFAANTVLPARAGEVLRPAILARERGLPFAALLASIVFERILDALSQLDFPGNRPRGPAAGEAPARFPPGGSAGWSPPSAAVAIGVALFAVVWRATTERVLERRLPHPAGARAAHRAAHRAHLPGRLRLPQERPGSPCSSAAGSLGDVGSHQRPDLLRHARVRAGPAPYGGLRRDHGRRPRARGADAGRRRRLSRGRAVRADRHLPRAARHGARASRSSRTPFRSSRSPSSGFAFFATSPLQKKGLRTARGGDRRDAPISDKLSSG